MSPRLLILGGTSGARALAEAVAARRISATYSLAGRVASPRPQPLPERVGGFGSVAGLAGWLRNNAITHVIDATHPFAAQMSRNAFLACDKTGVALAALTRPAWQAGTGDNWRFVPDMHAAVQALDGPPQRIFLAIGRTNLNEFAAHPQHFYLLCLVDPPENAPALPRHRVVVSRGPFTCEGDTDLLQRHDIGLVVSKNSGGDGARAKLDAARALGLPVLIIDRPVVPPRREIATPGEVLDWLAHPGTDLGV